VRSRVSCTVAAAILAASGLAHSAWAGRTYYGWLYGTEVMPERGVELQTWVLERDGLNPGDLRDSSLWIGALVGITDQLELALPVEFDWTDSDAAAGPDFTLRRYGAELRYRLVTQDPVEAPAFAPLVRFAVKRDVVDRDAVIFEGDIVSSYQQGRVPALVDLGAVATAAPDSEGGSHFQARPGAGISIRTVGDLRLGAEVYGEFDVDVSTVRWWGVGPNLAWTQGRFWLSAAYLIGIYNITAAPRLMWGVAF
jgi:hypothetical protein